MSRAITLFESMSAVVISLGGVSLRLVAVLCCMSLGFSQVPGPNVNIVSSDPLNPMSGDPFNQKQLEVDAAANPLNPNHILAGFIDYQALPSEETFPLKSPTANAWCGYSFSTNGGRTWKSGRVPGYRAGDMPDGSNSPIYGSVKCGDPVVTWDTSGHVFFMGLAVLADETTSLFVARFTDPDDGSGELDHDSTVLLATGNPSAVGQELDKPSILFVPSAAPGAGPGDGTLYACGTIFDGMIGGKFRTKVVCALSPDGGQTFTKPNQGKVNGNVNTNNGTWMAPAPGGGAYLFWRAFLGTESGYWFVKIDPSGAATAPAQAVGPNYFYPYDAPTRDDLARSNAFPTVAVDGDGRILLAFQAYSNSNGSAMASPAGSTGPRIFLTYSSNGGASWFPPRAVDYGPHANTFQFMPSLAVTGGGVFQVLYYDARFDGCLEPQPASCPGRPLTQVVDSSGVTQYLPTGRDRRFDVRVMQGRFDEDGELILGDSVQVNQYKYSTTTGRIMDRQAGCDEQHPCPALLYPFMPIAAQGTAAFIGDYIALVPAVPWVRNLDDPSKGPWRRATGTDDPGTIYAFYVSTEDVAFPLNLSLQPDVFNGLWTLFTPAGNSNPLPVCENPKTRDSNVYFSAISPGLLANWSGTSRQLQLGENGPLIPSQFTVTAENRSGQDAYFRLTIKESNAENWSFAKTEDKNTVDTLIRHNAGVSLPVYYLGASAPTSPVQVEVKQITSIGGSPVTGGLKTNVTYGTNLQLNNLQLNNLQLNNLQLNNLQLNNLQLNNLQLNNASPSNLQLNNLQLNNLQLNNLQLNNTLIPDTDATFTLTGTGALPTSANAITNVVNGQELLDANYRFQLMIYQTQMNPGVQGCRSIAVPTDMLISNVAIIDPSVNNLQLNNLQLNNLQLNNLQLNNSPLEDQVTNTTFVVNPGEEVKINLRAFKCDDCGSSAPSSASAADMALATAQTPVFSLGNLAQALFSGINPDGTQATSFMDPSPPVITPSVDPTVPGSGFFGSETVRVFWSVTDIQSGIVSSAQTISGITDDPITTSPCPATAADATPLTKDSSTTGIITVTCTATNGAGATATASQEIKFDKTPPVITPTVTGTKGQNDWYITDVTVSWVVDDPESGIASATTGCDTASFHTDTAGTTVTCSATNGAGLSNSVSVTFKIDQTPPVIKINAPANNATYLLNAAVPSSYTCDWSISGFATPCQGTVVSGENFSTSAVGANSFTVSATDQAGNTGTRTTTYTVAYKFTLISAKTPANLGSAVPLIWQLTDGNGSIVSDMSSLELLTAFFTGLDCSAPGPSSPGKLLYSPATGATGGSDYRFTASRFQFNWDTATVAATGPGCYAIEWKLKDTTSRVAAYVQLR